MILALRLPRAGRKAKPGVVGFDVSDGEGHLRVPLLVVTRRTRARTLRGHVVADSGDRRPVRVSWPRLDPGAYLDLTLEVIA